MTHHEMSLCLDRSAVYSFKVRVKKELRSIKIKSCVIGSSNAGESPIRCISTTGSTFNYYEVLRYHQN